MRKIILVVVALFAIFIGCAGNNEVAASRRAETSGEAAAVGAFPFPFLAQDLYGNDVTEEALGEKEAFFVYYWTTWCGTCVRAMPGLAELSREFEGRVGFLTLLGDFNTAADTAAAIKQNAGAEFTTVAANHADFAELFPLVQSGFLPTSIILDRDGNVIGEQMIGGSARTFRNAISDALERE
ncbi:MAG: TlpA family protein disulfide reductase [Defluviitaleaceae bacterium]|nr:TlpA family protein disulfide reductase [Defluviitaleaceae bacterium]